MNELEIPGSQSTPTITTDWARGRLHMTGNSYPENSFEFFAQVFAWIQQYLDGTDAALHLELGLIYMNTSSVKAMMDVFDMLEEAHAQSREVRVNWYYDPRNERVMEMAEEFREDYTFPFHILPTADD
ncbi:biofilm regulation phosphoprotein SiaC [Ectothiorhodospira sp. A-7Y]|nr:biofilm regulation phosphoprotein SiaC [Ectothiorhodospira lacustris]MCG5508769.1 biofilm regulation phosphoprotein SiaC [Ectothiorhodospira lacustris]MCG5520560.1 biofilm regulation phosphoprotein SiaC [Ectothiorhodospira lacustris]